MIDSHAHLGVCKPDNLELVADAARVGVDRILTVGMTPDSNREAVAIAEAHDGVFAAVGHHPNKAESASIRTQRRSSASSPNIRRYVRSARPASTSIAIVPASTSSGRRSAPRSRSPRETELPLVIHVRDAAVAGDGRAVAETFELLEAEAAGVTVILHCFSATPERAEQAAANGWLCSFAGNVTYPKAEGLREAAAVVPDEPDPGRDRQPVLGPAAGPRTTERAGQRRDHGRGRRRGARRLLRASSRRRSLQMRAGSSPGDGQARAELSRRHQSARSDRRRLRHSIPAMSSSRSAAARGC